MEFCIEAKRFCPWPVRLLRVWRITPRPKHESEAASPSVFSQLVVSKKNSAKISRYITSTFVIFDQLNSSRVEMVNNEGGGNLWRCILMETNNTVKPSSLGEPFLDSIGITINVLRLVVQIDHIPYWLNVRQWDKRGKHNGLQKIIWIHPSVWCP